MTDKLGAAALAQKIESACVFVTSYPAIGVRIYLPEIPRSSRSALLELDGSLVPASTRPEGSSGLAFTWVFLSCGGFRRHVLWEDRGANNSAVSCRSCRRL